MKRAVLVALAFGLAVPGLALMLLAIALVWIPAAIFAGGFALFAAGILVEMDPKARKRRTRQ